MTSTRTSDAHLFAIAAECDRLHEIWRKSCKAYSDAEGPMFAKRRSGEPISEAERAKVREADALNDADREAYIPVETRLLNTPAHTPQGLATKLRIFRLYHANTSDVTLFVDGYLLSGIALAVIRSVAVPSGIEVGFLGHHPEVRHRRGETQGHREAPREGAKLLR